VREKQSSAAAQKVIALRGEILHGLPWAKAHRNDIVYRD
jgi:uncharacterized protein involved in outer membrane biogenesis